MARPSGETAMNPPDGLKVVPAGSPITNRSGWLLSGLALGRSRSTAIRTLARTTASPDHTATAQRGRLARRSDHRLSAVDGWVGGAAESAGGGTASTVGGDASVGATASTAATNRYPSRATVSMKYGECGSSPSTSRSFITAVLS